MRTFSAEKFDIYISQIDQSAFCTMEQKGEKSGFRVNTEKDKNAKNTAAQWIE